MTEVAVGKKSERIAAAAPEVVFSVWTLASLPLDWLTICGRGIIGLGCGIRDRLSGIDLLIGGTTGDGESFGVLPLAWIMVAWAGAGLALALRSALSPAVVRFAWLAAGALMFWALLVGDFMFPRTNLAKMPFWIGLFLTLFAITTFVELLLDAVRRGRARSARQNSI